MKTFSQSLDRVGNKVSAESIALRMIAYFMQFQKASEREHRILKGTLEHDIPSSFHQIKRAVRKMIEAMNKTAQGHDLYLLIDGDQDKALSLIFAKGYSDLLQSQADYLRDGLLNVIGQLSELSSEADQFATGLRQAASEYIATADQFQPNASQDKTVEVMKSLKDEPELYVQALILKEMQEKFAPLVRKTLDQIIEIIKSITEMNQDWFQADFRIMESDVIHSLARLNDLIAHPEVGIFNSRDLESEFTFTDGDNIEMSCTLEPFISEQNFRQLFWNMYKNCIDHAHDKAQNKITTLAINGRFREDGTYILTFSDNGKGIAEEKIESVFIPAEQADASQQNQHRGLATWRDFVRSLGGDITVESTLGKGTTFTLIFPPAIVQPESVSEGSQVTRKYDHVKSN